MLTLARARGIKVFDDLSIGVVSMPMTVIAGLAQSRCRHRAGTDLARRRRAGRVSAAPARAVSRRRRPPPRADPGDRDVAVVVVQAGQQPNQHGHARPARPRPTVRSAARGPACATSTTQSASPRSDTVSDGTSVLQLSESAMTITSDGQHVAVRGQQSRDSDGEPDSSSPSTNTVDADGRVAAVGPKRRQMRCDACLVVGGAATVEPAVALGGLERRRVPLRVIAFGLHVVVGVQQHRRRSGGAGDGR